MRRNWLGLGLLLVVPWLASCVTRPEIRLDTGQGPPRVFIPSAVEPPPVEVHPEEFTQALAGLVLQTPMRLALPQREGRGVLASWGGREDEVQQTLLSVCEPTESPDDCLTLPKDAPPPQSLARMRLALSFALDTVWEGASVALSEVVDPLAFRGMVYSTMVTYLLVLMMPEPVTKGLAALLTVYLVAYLGFGPVWAMVEAGWQLLRDAERATSTEELKHAGHRFGRVLGDNGTRVLILLATAAFGGRAGFTAKGPKLPGFQRAALASRVRTGVHLPAAEQVKTMTLGAKGLVVGLAPTAVAATAMMPGGGASSANPGVESGSDAPPGLLDSQTRHIKKIDNIIRDHGKPEDFEGVTKELAGQRIPKPGGGYWNHIQEMRQSARDLKRHVKALEGSLENPHHAPPVRAYVQSSIEKANAMISRMETTLAGGSPHGR